MDGRGDHDVDDDDDAADDYDRNVVDDDDDDENDDENEDGGYRGGHFDELLSFAPSLVDSGMPAARTCCTTEIGQGL
eukprot:3188189-Amphidinium_carterae.1